MQTDFEIKEPGSIDVHELIQKYKYEDEIKTAIETENLLPAGLLQRLQACYPQHSSLKRSEFLFNEKDHYSGLRGFREILGVLERNGIDIGYQKEREFFLEVYRFLATKHSLNAIDWSNFEKDSMFQLIFPQPGMISQEEVAVYAAARTKEERARVVEDY